MLKDPDRYVLMRSGVDGILVSVQPVSNLQDGRKQLAIRIACQDDGWRLVDLVTNDSINLES
jgi:hypothetical protein